MNNWQGIGRLTNNPELKKTTNGTSVVKFSIAIDRRFQKGKTDFIRCEAWKTTAENIAKYFFKGDKIGITGALQTDSFEDSKGIKRDYSYILVDSFDFCEKKEKNEDVKKAVPEIYEVPDDDDNLPF